jgi:hypothetical protein
MHYNDSLTMSEKLLAIVSKTVKGRKGNGVGHLKKARVERKGKATAMKVTTKMTPDVFLPNLYPIRVRHIHCLSHILQYKAAVVVM